MIQVRIFPIWILDLRNNGKSYHGESEHDQSAYAEAISLYTPVVDPETKRAIGVMKTVCDITDIGMEL